MKGILSVFLMLPFFTPAVAAEGTPAAHAAALDETGRYWTEAAMTWMDSQWDEAAGLLGSKRNHGIRGSAHYAAGLLFRNGEGDARRAAQCIAAVLENQYDAPATVYHGVWKRRAEDPEPPERPQTWKHFDPNWREFIGLTLILNLEAYAHLLPDDLATGIRQALYRAAEGAYARKVDPGYSNIAIMSAYLLAWAGENLAQPAWARHGRQLMNTIYQDFSAHETLGEYNSPTYYGVNLCGLGLWRRWPVWPEMAEKGRAMEDAVWRDIARFYHAGMKNLCGPFDRAYGMDMRRYASLCGFWIALNVPIEKAPLAPPAENPAKTGEYQMMPVYALLRRPVPEDVLPHLLAFQGPRRIERPIGAKGDRTATAWLSETVMIGGGEPPRGKVSDRQAHPVTLHWRTPAGGIGWMRLRSHAPAHATASEKRLDIRCRNRVAISTYDAVTFEFHLEETAACHLTRNRWQLPGLEIAVETELTGPEIERSENRVSVSYPVPEKLRTETVTFRLRVEP
jgi:hypothetical protein